MELMTDKEVGALVKASAKHVRNLVERNEFPPPIRLGRCVRWRRQDVESFIAKRCESSGAAR